MINVSYGNCVTDAQHVCIRMISEEIWRSFKRCETATGHRYVAVVTVKFTKRLIRISLWLGLKQVLPGQESPVFWDQYTTLISRQNVKFNIC